MSDSDVTMMLHAIERGDPEGAERLLPLVYDELRRLANHLMQGEKPGQTLQATALVHEAYVRLVGAERQGWEDRRHFFNACAMAMRRVLLDRARRKGRLKHGGEYDRQHMDAVDIPATQQFAIEDFEAVEAALEELAAENPRWAEVVQLRLFLGMSVEQTAELVGVSKATVKNDWRFAISLIRRKVGKSETDET